MEPEKEVCQRQLSSLREAVSKLVHRSLSSLTVASGNAQLMRMRGKEKFSQEYLDQLKQIEERIQWAGGVFQRLMRFSKQTEEKVTALEMDDLVKEAIESFSGEFSSEQIQTQVHLNAGGTILANPVSLKEAVVELLTNACRAMEGKGKIVVRTERSGASVRLLVQDTGKGIAPEIVKDKIFQPFYTTQKDRHGLGLYLTHLIVSIHGGTLRCESEAGKGTTFTIEIPGGA